MVAAFASRRLTLHAGLLSLACFLLYAALAARDVMFGDGSELTAAAILNGVAHPPGYPLWIVLGHLASLVPAGTLAYRINLTAALYHALTVGVVFVTGTLLTRSRMAGLFAAVLLAIGSPLFVSWSLQAEVFSLNDLFAAAIVLLSVRWLQAPQQWRLVVPIAALFGLGLANQQTLILLAPVVLWVAWCGREAIPRDATTLKVTALAIIVGFLGLALPYVHTLLASRGVSDLHLGTAHTLGELIDLIDRRSFGTLNLVTGAAAGGSFLARTGVLLGSGGWPFLFMAIGVVVLALQRRYRELGIALLTLAFALIAFCWLANMNTTDPQMAGIFSRFGLLPLAALAPFAACAFAALQSALRAVPFERYASAAVLVITAGVCAIQLPGLSLADAHGPRVVFRDALNALPPHAILMTAGEGVDDPAWYFQAVEHMRPDVTIVTYALVGYPKYAAALRDQINVPPVVDSPLAPPVLRDVLAGANSQRTFFVIGERGLHVPGPLYKPYVLGIVSQMIPRNAKVDVALHYQNEVRLQSGPGYGDIPPVRWTSNGYAGAIREYYAGGFFMTGLDAQSLGKFAAARLWYEGALSYFPDPMIAQRIAALPAVQ